MKNELQSIINNAKMFDTIKLEGEIKLEMPQSSSFFVGKSFSKNLINITKPNLTIDGSGAIIRVDTADELTSDTNIFFISSMAKNVEIKNLKLFVYINSLSIVRQIVGIYNTAYGLKLTNCHIEIISEYQTNLVGILNNGNLETHMETRADNLVIDNSFIKTQVLNKGEKDSKTYGLFNHLANSISVQNTFIYSNNIGTGENQQAIGVYTNGRFGRFVGNNFKANGSHNIGKEKEQAYAYGFINEGLYNLINSNNIIGEWGGQCIGLENTGDFAKVSGNKILATHTIKGRPVRNFANDCLFDGNILTSTSKNPRLFQHDGSNCLITNNLMEALLGWRDYKSSVGIYAVSENAKENIISNNIIKNVCDCGIITNKNIGILTNNIITTFEDFNGLVKQASGDNLELLNKLNEEKIVSIYE